MHQSVGVSEHQRWCGLLLTLLLTTQVAESAQVVYMGGFCDDVDAGLDDALLVFDSSTTCYNVMNKHYTFSCLADGTPQAQAWTTSDCTTPTTITNFTSGCLEDAHIFCAEDAQQPSHTTAIMSAYRSENCMSEPISNLAIRDTCPNAVAPSFALSPGRNSSNICDDDDGCVEFFASNLGFIRITATCYTDDTILVEFFRDTCDESYFRATVSPGACFDVGTNYTGTVSTFTQYLLASVGSFSFTCVDAAPQETPPGDNPDTLFVGGLCESENSTINNAGIFFLSGECYSVGNGHYTFACDADDLAVVKEWDDPDCTTTYVYATLEDSCFTGLDDPSQITCSVDTPTATTAVAAAYSSGDCSTDLIAYLPIRDNCEDAPSMAYALNSQATATVRCSADQGCMDFFQADLGYLRIVATCDAEKTVNVVFYKDDCSTVAHNMSFPEGSCLAHGTKLTMSSSSFTQFLLAAFGSISFYCVDEAEAASSSTSSASSTSFTSTEQPNSAGRAAASRPTICLLASVFFFVLYFF